MKEEKKELRDQIEKDMAKFLKEGGQITHVPAGQGVLNHLQKESYGLYQRRQNIVNENIQSEVVKK